MEQEAEKKPLCWLDIEDWRVQHGLAWNTVCELLGLSTQQWRALSQSPTAPLEDATVGMVLTLYKNHPELMPFQSPSFVQFMTDLGYDPTNLEDRKRCASALGRETKAAYRWLEGKSMSKSVKRLMELIKRFPASSGSKKKKRELLESLALEVAARMGVPDPFGSASWRPQRKETDLVVAEEPIKHRTKIDITIVQFYQSDQVPKHIRVTDITLPLMKEMPGYITGLSGHYYGLMYARQYAEKSHQEMVAIDIDALYQRPLSYREKRLTLETLKEHDVLNILRANKKLIAHIAAYWKQWMSEEEGAEVEKRYDWKRPEDFMAHRPDFIPRLLQQEEFAHINLLTHPVYTSFHDEPLTVTSFRAGYALIQSANARLHPDIKVTLD